MTLTRVAAARRCTVDEANLHLSVVRASVVRGSVVRASVTVTVTVLKVRDRRFNGIG